MATQEFSLVCQSDIVFADTGDDVLLPCQIEPASSAVSMEIKWCNKSDLVCHYKDGQVTEGEDYEGRVSFVEDLHSGNVSLKIRDVRSTDRGHYICEVLHKDQMKKCGYVFLYVRFQNVTLVAPTGTVYANSGEDVTLPVHISPETSAVYMTIRWKKMGEVIYQYKNREERSNRDYENRVSLFIQELQRGNVSLTLRNVQQSDSGIYICQICYEGFSDLKVVQLQVRVEDEGTHTLEEQVMDEDREQRNFPDTRYLPTYNPTPNLCNLMKEMNQQNPALRRSNSSEGIPPLMEDEGTHTLEEQVMDEDREQRNVPDTRYLPTYNPTPNLCNLMKEMNQQMFDLALIYRRHMEELLTQNPALRRSNSREGIPPLMEAEGTSQSTMQEFTGTENVRYTPVLQPQAQQAFITPAATRTQMQERPLATTQRTDERIQNSIRAGERLQSSHSVTPIVLRTQTQERPVTTTQRSQEQRQENNPTVQASTSDTQPQVSESERTVQTQESSGATPRTGEGKETTK